MLRNPFYSVLALVSHLIALAVLFLLLRADFVAAAQVVVYAGAVMVLYVFVVRLHRRHSTSRFAARAPASPAFWGRSSPPCCSLEITVAVVGSSLGALDTRGAGVGAGFGSPGQIGELLLTKFLLALRGDLLLAAGGRRRRRGAGTQAPRPGRARALGRRDLRARRGRPRRGGPRRPETLLLMDVAWFVVLSGFIFAIGAAGVLTRRSPMVVLLCLELMLNAGNLALVAFSQDARKPRRSGVRAGRDGGGRLRGRGRPGDHRRHVPQAA
ncbi:MAG: NADH-quinone oxidoreductase subunit J [Thermoleophilaceae bacterium]